VPQKKRKINVDCQQSSQSDMDLDGENQKIDV